jgi:uncharacterized protein (DUF433 family)
MKALRMSKTKSHVGVGLYSIAEASRILRAPPSSIHRWASPALGLVPRYFDSDEKTITFLELMELQFVRMFRAEGVSLQTIRKASLAAGKKYDTSYPFCVKRFDTDGKTIFATLVSKESDQEVIEDLKRGQLVFQEILKPFFRKLEYRGSIEPARFWPNEKAGRIVLDPARKFGKPIEAETGIPTRTIYDAVNAGEGHSHAAVAHWFGIPVSAVDAAVNFERSLAA